MENRYYSPFENGSHAENKEREAPSVPQWLAGVFESGGTMTFAIQKHKKEEKEYVYSSPLLALADKSEDRVDFLVELLGGTKQYSDTSRNWNWRLNGKKVVDVAELILPFSVTRKPTLEAYLEWEAADREERVQIALERQQKGRGLAVAVEDYEEAMTHTPFVAGLIDYRGSFSKIHSRGAPPEGYQALMVYNTNKNLLDALKNKFNGRVRLGHERNSTKSINGKTFQTKNDSYYWSPTLSDTLSVIKTVQPYLLMNPREITE